MRTHSATTMSWGSIHRKSVKPCLAKSFSRELVLAMVASLACPCPGYITSLAAASIRSASRFPGPSVIIGAMEKRARRADRDKGWPADLGRFAVILVRPDSPENVGL